MSSSAVEASVVGVSVVKDEEATTAVVSSCPSVDTLAVEDVSGIVVDASAVGSSVLWTEGETKVFVSILPIVDTSVGGKKVSGSAVDASVVDMSVLRVDGGTTVVVSCWPSVGASFGGNVSDIAEASVVGLEGTTVVVSYCSSVVACVVVPGIVVATSVPGASVV